MLGIDWIKILIHLVVFAILAVGLYLLLYKPILRFIKTRQETIQKGLDDGKAMQEEAQQVRAAYDEKLAELDNQREDMLRQAALDSQAIVDAATEAAAAEREAIRRQALAEAEAAKQQAVADLQQEAGTVALNLVGEILHREISAEENEQLIADCLQAWSDHD